MAQQGTDYLKMYDPSAYLCAADLNGQEVTVQIEKCTGGEVVGDGGKKSKKPILTLVGTSKKFAIGKTIGKVIAGMYGRHVEGWAGKWITLFETTTKLSGEIVPCIRVKPIVPTPPEKPAKSAKDGAQ